ncbi:MAG: DUF4912 domain-containing protein [Dethiobacteraceae bacterium]
MSKSLTSAESSLHLMVQTPTSLFVYWEITEEYLDLARSALQEVFTGIWLRLMREGESGHEVVESRYVSEHLTSGSLYFSSKRSYSTYFAELAVAYHGSFFTLLRSVSALLPPDGRVEEKLSNVITSPLIIPPALPFAYSPTNQQYTRGE